MASFGNWDWWLISAPKFAIFDSHEVWANAHHAGQGMYLATMHPPANCPCHDFIYTVFTRICVIGCVNTLDVNQPKRTSVHILSRAFLSQIWSAAQKVPSYPMHNNDGVKVVTLTVPSTSSVTTASPQMYLISQGRQPNECILDQEVGQFLWVLLLHCSENASL